MTVPVLATVVLPDTDGLPRDEVQNGLAFLCGDTTALLAAANLIVAGIIPAFYNTQYGGRGIGDVIGSSRDRTAGACLIHFYDLTGHLDGSPHGSPVFTTGWTLRAREAGTVNLPMECAVALSYHSDLTGVLEHGGPDASIPTEDRAVDEGAPAVHAGSDRPRSRDRGRIFLGPLVTEVFTTGPHPMVDSGMATMIGDAASALKAGAAAMTPPAAWSVWSRRNATLTPIVGGWVDDAPDTIRGRGQQSTSKTLWT